MLTFKCLKRNIIIVALYFLSTMATEAQMIKTSGHGIIPAPDFVVVDGKKKSDINDLKIYLSDLDRSPYLDLLVASSEKMHMTSSEMANVSIKLLKYLKPEEYHLKIKKNRVHISAGSNAGIQYALVSLTQLVLNHGFPLPIIDIKDKPKFKYRGMHLDVSRHFYSVEDVKKHLNYMAYYKYNHFHWHLTDDQGWRIEIKKYPKLQEIAAFRSETLIGHYNDQPQRYDGKKYGGFYTQDEIRDIVAYAAARNIHVIPEIEMPGHAQAALAAYPEFGCENKKYEVATKWGIFEDVFCPNEVTFKFLEDVIDEVITLFPGKYIHIGGDECPKDAWKRSNFCQELIKNNNLKDEHGLQSYFITRMEKYINSKGKQIIGWDEILEGGLAPNATVMSWRGIEGGIAAAKENHDVIMTPGTHCYFDHYQSEDADEPLAIGGYTPLEKVYSWNPVPQKLEKEKHKYILGGQANLWSEYIKTYSGVEYMVYARGMAMSEALWSRKKNYPDFLKRYTKQNEWWKSKGVNIANHLYELKPKIKAGKGKPVTVSFVSASKSSISHFIDGVETKPAVSGSEIIIDRSGNHTFLALAGEKKGKPIQLNFDLHLGTTAILSLIHAPSKQYAGNGPGSIVNGLTGSDEKYGGSEWLGFDGKNCSGVLDFGKEIVASEINFRFFKGEGQWIYLPQKVEIYTSDDGKTFNSVQINNDIKSENKIARVNIELGNIKTRYLKFDITNYGKIPDGAQGAGQKAWLFVDEVVVR